MKLSVLSQPFVAGRRLGDVLFESLADNQWSDLTVAVAFAKMSGAKHVLQPLTDFTAHAHCQFYLGVDHSGTSYDALAALLSLQGDNFNVSVVHNRGPYTFHPKLFLFKNETNARLIVGSGNLTEGGLFTNYEGGLDVYFDLNEADDLNHVKEVEQLINQWASHPSHTSIPLTEDLLQYLQNTGLAPLESTLPGAGFTTGSHTAPAATDSSKFFGYATVAKPPVPSTPTSVTGTSYVPATSPVPSSASSDTGTTPFFVMTLQQTDVGVGQTTKGTSRRSPEIFIPLAARDANPEFWGWPDQFEEDTSKKKKYDRTNVVFRIAGADAYVNMMTWPDKSDFRLRSEALRSAGEVGDILKMQQAPAHAPFDYMIEIIPTWSAEHHIHLSRCTNKTRGKSNRRWGYYLLS